MSILADVNVDTIKVSAIGQADVNVDKIKVLGPGFTTKLSSARLVYKHYGLDVERVYLAVYKSFMEAIDAVDNGIRQYDTDSPPKYANDKYLSARVGRMNPDGMDENSPEKEDQAFHQAMELAG
ncbi:hypothetical protein R1sor_017310 [Riccia sorocarpa]|uniref:Uncharacterized protein n=1 Tax=Riccia sorocarpa TaxID=122646 RepID=A0ABD3I6F4_9MARC